MTPLQIRKLADRLWDKHAHADKHGYKDWMAEDNFLQAIAEAIEPLTTALSAMARCPGFHTTDQYTGETFAEIARRATTPTKETKAHG